MTTLSQLLERHGRGLPWDIALALCVRMLEEVARLRRGRARHRPIDLSNLVLGSDGSLSIVDGGTGHQAPELADGGAPTEAADLWAIGRVLYELLTDEAPAGADPVPPIAMEVDIPQAVSDLAMGFLKADPAQRPPGVAAALGAVTVLLDAAGTSADELLGPDLPMRLPEHKPKRLLVPLGTMDELLHERGFTSWTAAGLGAEACARPPTPRPSGPVSPNSVARVARWRVHLIAVAVSVIAALVLVLWLALPPVR